MEIEREEKKHSEILGDTAEIVEFLVIFVPEKVAENPYRY